MVSIRQRREQSLSGDSPRGRVTRDFQLTISFRESRISLRKLRIKLTISLRKLRIKHIPLTKQLIILTSQTIYCFL